MDKTKVKCPKCGYVWLTSSKLEFITCPNCQRRVKKSESVVKVVRKL